MKSILIAALVALLICVTSAASMGDIGWDQGPPPYDPHDKKWHDPNNAFHWYPMECCHMEDCAPVLKVERDDKLKGRWMTTKHGRAWVPDSKKLFTAKDKEGKEVDFIIPAFEKVRLHVCMRRPHSSDPKPAHGDKHVICLFGETNG